MINSLLIFLSSLNINKKVSLIFSALWLLFLIYTTNYELGLMYPIISAVIFLLVTLSINQFAKNKYLNGALSSVSILIWSGIIDVICYYIYPVYSQGQTLFGYILNGLAFNYKYVIVNLILLSVIYVGQLIIIKNSLVKVKQEIINNKINKNK